MKEKSFGETAIRGGLMAAFVDRQTSAMDADMGYGELAERLNKHCPQETGG